MKVLGCKLEGDFVPRALSPSLHIIMQLLRFTAFEAINSTVPVNEHVVE